MNSSPRIWISCVYLSILIAISGCAQGESGRYIAASDVSYKAKTMPLQSSITEFSYKAPVVGTNIVVSETTVTTIGDKVKISESPRHKTNTVISVEGMKIVYNSQDASSSRIEQYAIIGHVFIGTDENGRSRNIPDSLLLDAFWPVKPGKSVQFDVALPGALQQRTKYTVLRFEKLESKIGNIDTVYIEGVSSILPTSPTYSDVIIRRWYAPTLGVFVRSEIEPMTRQWPRMLAIVEVVEITTPH